MGHIINIQRSIHSEWISRLQHIRGGYFRMISLLLILLAIIVSGTATTTYQQGFIRGFTDGRDHPFNATIFKEQRPQEFQDGFIAGCLSVQGKTPDVCEHAMIS